MAAGPTALPAPAAARAGPGRCLRAVRADRHLPSPALGTPAGAPDPSGAAHAASEPAADVAASAAPVGSALPAGTARAAARRIPPAVRATRAVRRAGPLPTQLPRPSGTTPQAAD